MIATGVEDVTRAVEALAIASLYSDGLPQLVQWEAEGYQDVLEGEDSRPVVQSVLLSLVKRLALLQAASNGIHPTHQRDAAAYAIRELMRDMRQAA